MVSAKKTSKKKLSAPLKGDIESMSDLVQNLKELHSWQGAVLDKLVRQAQALQKAKKG